MFTSLNELAVHADPNSVAFPWLGAPLAVNALCQDWGSNWLLRGMSITG